MAEMMTVKQASEIWGFSTAGLQSCAAKERFRVR